MFGTKKKEELIQDVVLSFKDKATGFEPVFDKAWQNHGGYIAAFKSEKNRSQVIVVLGKEDPMNSTFNTNQVYTILRFVSGEPWLCGEFLTDGGEIETFQKLLIV